jgi:hypothetical protein
MHGMTAKRIIVPNGNSIDDLKVHIIVVMMPYLVFGDDDANEND